MFDEKVIYVINLMFKKMKKDFNLIKFFYFFVIVFLVVILFFCNNDDNFLFFFLFINDVVGIYNGKVLIILVIFVIVKENVGEVF